MQNLNLVLSVEHNNVRVYNRYICIDNSDNFICIYKYIDCISFCILSLQKESVDCKSTMTI